MQFCHKLEKVVWRQSVNDEMFKSTFDKKRLQWTILKTFYDHSSTIIESL